MARGLYIHIPFCKKKCYYCDFASKVPKENEIDEYLELLDIEMRQYNLKNESIDTIFIGGGTPSILSVVQLERLFEIIGKNVNMNGVVEYSIESNPGTLDYQKMKVMKARGVNRLSIGLQAVQDRHLKFMGRIHNLEDFDENFILARKAGFDNINVDVIFAFEGQTMDDLRETIEHITKLNPEHISAYSLIIEENTNFYDRYVDGELNEIDENLYVQMYRYIVGELEKKGYSQYEISNFCKNGKECRHNLNYWDCGEYFGLGISASGYLDGVRYVNYKKISDYSSNISSNKKPIDISERLSMTDIYNETIMLGLRKNSGIDFLNIYHTKEKYIETYKYDKMKAIKRKLEQFIDDGYIEMVNERIVLTQKGREISNAIIVELML